VRYVIYIYIYIYIYNVSRLRVKLELHTLEVLSVPTYKNLKDLGRVHVGAGPRTLLDVNELLMMGRGTARNM